LVILSLKRKKRRLAPPLSHSLKLPVVLENCILIKSDFASHGISFSEITPLGTYGNFDSHDLASPEEKLSKPLYIKYESSNRIFYAGPVYKDEVSVRVLFMEKKKTFIYIQEPSGKYYFDLAFLYE